MDRFLICMLFHVDRTYRTEICLKNTFLTIACCLLLISANIKYYQLQISRIFTSIPKKTRWSCVCECGSLHCSSNDSGFLHMTNSEFRQIGRFFLSPLVANFNIPSTGFHPDFCPTVCEVHTNSTQTRGKIECKLTIVHSACSHAQVNVLSCTSMI